MNIHSSMAITPYIQVQQISGVNPVHGIEAATPIQESFNVDFDRVMRAEVQKAIPTLPVENIDRVDFNGIADYIDYRNMINEIVPKQLNEIAGRFQDRVGYYDASGNTGTYEYHSFDLVV